MPGHGRPSRGPVTRERQGVASRTVHVDGMALHYLEAGTGSPLILLHGTAIDSASLSYAASIPRLSAAHHVVAPDWPGYGSSERSGGLPTRSPVDLLGRLLDTLELPRVHLVGFSMGGAAALGFALDDPERVASLTIIGGHGLDPALPVPLLPYLALRVPAWRHGVAWGFRRSRALTALVLRHVVFGDPRGVTDELVDEVHRQLRTPAAEGAFVAWLDEELGPWGYATSHAHRLDALDVRTLLLHGRRDRVVSWRKARTAATRMPDARLVVFPACGHWLPREAPEAFVRELLGFTAEVDAARSEAR
jgi:pimeloyl-ACP methyl ester carboxylesterase